MPASLAPAPRRWLNNWIRRRARAEPPLTLGYRQIFILPTAFGWLLGVLMFAMLMGSLNFNNNLGLLTTFIVAGIALMSMLVAYRNLEGIEISGTSAPPVFAGDPLEINVRLAESSGHHRLGVTIAGPSGSTTGQLAAGRAESIQLAIPTVRRGRLQPGRLRIQTRHPLGLFEVWSWFWPEREFLVWPRPAAHPPPLPIGQAHTGSPRPGDESDEFHGLRDWREGDPLHRSAWKASQRHQTLLARQFTQFDNEDLQLKLDAAPGRDLEERLSVLAAWVIEADQRGLLYTLDLGAVRIGPDQGESHRVRCLDALAEHT